MRNRMRNLHKYDDNVLLLNMHAYTLYNNVEYNNNINNNNNNDVTYL